ncbi:uncharacterized protein PAC_15712 [Phialocephala subalpina]|uniref:Uncharacterized protein n=1 Tax=Phialocephala subalpina TaxID=576137 RepID=A0A1L7XL99_9HELO|nr:uncharacterized protein PAC_15712 [Phialocephala subalpina]
MDIYSQISELTYLEAASEGFLTSYNILQGCDTGLCDWSSANVSSLGDEESADVFITSKGGHQLLDPIIILSTESRNDAVFFVVKRGHLVFLIFGIAAAAAIGIVIDIDFFSILFPSR